MPKWQRPGRLVAFLLVDRRALWAICAVYFAAGLVFLHYDYVLNDEGLITHYAATWAWIDFPAVFFLQKAKPILVVLYSLPSRAGPIGSMFAHLAVSTTAPLLIGEAARGLGHRLPNLPALIVAFSPVFFLGGAAGISNNDAIVGTALGLFLMTRGYSFLGGLVVGCLPWVRSEMVPLVGVLGLHAILHGDRRFAVGAAAFPLLYLLTGVAYHVDPLWIIHYPPSSPFNPQNPMWAEIPVGPRFLLGLLPAVTPVAALITCTPVRALRPLERAILVYTLGMLVLLEILPVYRIGNFGGSPRYMAQLLPGLALFAARALEVPWRGNRLPLPWVLLAFTCTAWAVTRVPGMVLVVPCLLIFFVLLLFGSLGSAKIALVSATLMIAAGPLLAPGARIARTSQAPYLAVFEDWFSRNRSTIQGPVYTNAQLLHAFAERRGLIPAGAVRFLIGFDHLEGTLALSNPHNGQQAAIRKLCEESFYGRGVIAQDLRPSEIPPHSLFALRLDRRLHLTLPPTTWGPQLRTVFEYGNARIALLRPTAASSAPDQPSP